MINFTHNTRKYNTTPTLQKFGMTRCSDCGHLIPVDAIKCTKCHTGILATITKKSKINGNHK